MRFAAIALILAVSCRPPSSSTVQPRLTMDVIFSGAWSGSPRAPKWSPDGQWLAFLWRDGLWLAPREGEPTELRRAKITDFAWRPDGRALVTVGDGELNLIAVADGEVTKVAGVGTGAHELRMSPAGRLAAFLDEGDLWGVELDDGAVARWTQVGLPNISKNGVGRYNRPEREIGPGIWGGPTYAWSPDGRFIAVHQVDRRQMRKVPFPDYLAEETDPNWVRRGYPGDVNERRAIGLLDVERRALRMLPLDRPNSVQIVGFAWSGRGELLVDRATDTAEERWLHVYNPQDEALRTIWHSRRPSRIYTRFGAAWHPDDRQVVFLSDREDRYGLYLLDPAYPRDAPRRLTDPDHDVLSAPLLSGGALYYAGNGSGVVDRHVYRVDLTSGETAQLTRRPGAHRAFPSPDGRWLASLHDDDVTPPELDLIGPGRSTRLTASVPEDAPALQRARYVQLPTAEGQAPLHLRLLIPPGVKRRPVVFGPVYSNTARNRWLGSYGLVQQHFLEKGYVVAQVDVRGSTGYGRRFREDFLNDFAGQDLEDLERAVDYVKTLASVDPERIGIWGSSYGGTLSIYSMLEKPGLFKAGAAAAAAVDPAFFGTDDVAIVRPPRAEVFERTARRRAHRLQDHLLIIHGMQDQVVPFKTTVVFADALIRAGKDFDFAFAPGATHAWSREAPYARYLFTKLVSHFDRHLRP